jgi:hypothetical protein
MFREGLMRGSFIDFLDLEEDEGRSDFTEMPLSMKD